jgi:hypothetical protein
MGRRWAQCHERKKTEPPSASPGDGSSDPQRTASSHRHTRLGGPLDIHGGSPASLLGTTGYHPPMHAISRLQRRHPSPADHFAPPNELQRFAPSSTRRFLLARAAKWRATRSWNVDPSPARETVLLLRATSSPRLPHISIVAALDIACSEWRATGLIVGTRRTNTLHPLPRTRRFPAWQS